MTNKYIDAEKLTKAIEEKGFDCSFALKMERLDTLALIDELQREQPKEICSKCIHHGKDDGYCYNPHGGMQSLINENGIYECTGFCEQDQPEVDEVDLEKEYKTWWSSISGKINIEHMMEWYMHETARHFYELARQKYEK